MQRPLGVLVVVALVAVALLFGNLPFGNVLPAAAPPPASDVGRTTAATGLLDLATPACVAEAALSRVAVVAAPEPESRDEPASALTFRMTGAPPEDLHGVAFVRRKDGSTTEVAFENGSFVASNRATLDGVSLRAPGFAIAWPRLGTDAHVIEVPMRRAGEIRVRLVDTQGRPLAHRWIGMMCQGQTEASPPGVGYQANPRAVTDDDGIAMLENAVPGTHDVFAVRVAEWQPVQVHGLAVHAGAVTDCELVAEAVPQSLYGGFRFPRSAAPSLKGFANDVSSHIFACRDGRQYMLAFLGDEVRCIVKGMPGDLVTGSIVPIDYTGGGKQLPPVSTPITVTVGAVLDWHPIWVR
ncbi:MAG: hypothetical protein H6838_10095 [Planctomycetes bacterium]|nr:hypothetical protein [Planctomycetota bacterium]MCB9885835.1 hypothetical protein [Planctomycetota bacterium]